MSKKYFAKYLPVEGEIKEGDTAYNEGDGIHNFDKVNCHPAGCKKVKLFLCSRDIQVGDAVICTLQPERATFMYEEQYSKEWCAKVIGEVSPEAIWVKEGMEFDESDIQAWAICSEEKRHFHYHAWNKGIKYAATHSLAEITECCYECDCECDSRYFKIKCSQCKTFH